MNSILGDFGASLKRRDPLSKKVADMLRSAIIHGQLAPGTRLIEENIAEELGISRVPVREAIRSLEKYGFVKIESGQGAHVKGLTVKDVEDIYDVRIMIEIHALDACINHNLKMSIQLLQEQIDCLNELTQSEEPDQFALVDKDIHFDDILCSSCGNNKIDEIWQLLRASIQWVFAINPYYAQKNWSDHASHQAIVDLLKNNDYEGAKLLLREHIEASQRSTLSAFRQMEEGKEAK